MYGYEYMLPGQTMYSLNDHMCWGWEKCKKTDYVLQLSDHPTATIEFHA